MDAIFEPLSSAIGVEKSQLKMLACFFISYPLGSIYVRIPKENASAKHWFSIAVSLFFLLGMLDLWSGTLHVLGSSLFTYFLAANWRSNNMPWAVFGAVMSHLLISHIWRFLYPSEVVEISGAQMVLTMKLSTFAWNVYDGRRPKEELDKSQLQTRVVKFPSLLEFLGYVFYFPAFLVGPATEFTGYMALVNETLYDVPSSGATTPADSDSGLSEKADTQRKSRKRVPKGRKRYAYIKMLIGIVNFGLFAVFGGKFAYQVMLEDWFVKKSFLYRLLYTQGCGFFQRTKYYGAWCVTEGACIFTGYGFNGFTPSGDTKWDGAANVDIMNIEFHPNFKILLDSWNINTNTWLRNCVYKRVTPQGQKPGFASSMMTFLTSAIWHGIYPGYYMTFVFGGFVTSVARQSRSYLRPLLLPPLLPPRPSNLAPPPTVLKRVYDVVGTLTSLLVLNYIVVPFCVLYFSDSIKIWSRLNWYGHVMVFGALFIYSAGGKTWLKKISQERVRKATAAQQAEIQALKTESEKQLGTSMQIPPVDIAVKGIESKVHEATIQAEQRLKSTGKTEL